MVMFKAESHAFSITVKLARSKGTTSKTAAVLNKEYTVTAIDDE